jgi:hypothetical protein
MLTSQILGTEIFGVVYNGIPLIPSSMETVQLFQNLNGKNTNRKYGDLISIISSLKKGK